MTSLTPFSWLDPNRDSSFGSAVHTAIRATHTNKQCWNDEVVFDASRRLGWNEAIDTLGAWRAQLAAGHLEYAVPGSIWHPGHPVSVSASGTHPTELAPGDRVMWTKHSHISTGHVVRVHTLTNWSYRRGQLPPRSASAFAVVQRDDVSETEMAMVRASNERSGRKTTKRSMESYLRVRAPLGFCYRISGDADPKTWTNSLTSLRPAPDDAGRRFELDFAGAVAFVDARLAQLDGRLRCLDQVGH